MTWVRDAGERRGLLGFEKRVLRRGKNTSPFHPGGGFSKKIFSGGICNQAEEKINNFLRAF